MTRVRYVSAVASLVIGVVWLFQPAPFWWMGTGAVLGGALTAIWTGRQVVQRAWSYLGESHEWFGFEVVPRNWLLEAACITVILGLTVVMLPGPAVGDRPVSHDHPVHFFKAWQLEQTFLADGQLWGWSHVWFGGYPAQYLYPIGADLLVVAIHLLGLGLLDFGHAYALGVVAFWFLTGYAVFRFGARGFGRWVGLLAALLFMTDNGSNGTGGWIFTIEWGVWPMSLAVVLGAWSMARVPDLMQGDRWRDIGIFGLLMGAALLTHPFMMIHHAIALTTAVVAYWLADTERPLTVAVGRLAAGAAVGSAIGALWMLPFFASEPFMDSSFGGRWATMLEMGSRLYNLDLFYGTWGFAVALGFLGTVMLVWHRGVHHLLTGMLSLGFFVFGASDFLSGFHLMEYFGSLQRVQFSRIITLLKPYWMVAAGYAVVAVARETGRHAVDFFAQGDEPTPHAQPAFRRWVRLFLIGLALAPLLVTFGFYYGENRVRHDLETNSERPDHRARRQLVEWFERNHPDGKPFCRIATRLHKHDHRFVDLARRLPFPIYKFGYTPATSYTFRPQLTNPEALRAFNIRYVISLGGPPRRGDFEKVADFSGVNLYEYEEWRRQPFRVIEGAGDVELKSFEREEIVLEAASGSEGRLRLNVSNFSRWSATRNGEPISISETRISGSSATGFITVELEPGTYRFVFRRGWTEWFAFVLFLLGLGFVGLFVAADREGRYTNALRRGLARLQHRVAKLVGSHEVAVSRVGVAAALVVIGAATWMAWGAPALDVPDRPLRSLVERTHYDFADNLREATVQIDRGGSYRACSGLADWHICGKKTWKVVQPWLADFGHEISMKRCIWTHPRGMGPTEIEFRGVPAGDAIVGFSGVVESGRVSEAGPVDLAVEINGERQYEGETDAKDELFLFRAPIPESERGERLDVRFVVSANQPQRRHFCFNGQVVDLDPSVEWPASKGAEK